MSQNWWNKDLFSSYGKYCKYTSEVHLGKEIQYTITLRKKVHTNSSSFASPRTNFLSPRNRILQGVHVGNHKQPYVNLINMYTILPS